MSVQFKYTLLYQKLPPPPSLNHPSLEVTPSFLVSRTQAGYISPLSVQKNKR